MANGELLKDTYIMLKNGFFLGYEPENNIIDCGIHIT